jgi:hypothetical protein
MIGTMDRTALRMGLVLALGMAAGRAHADDAGAQAQVLFDEGKKLMDAANYAAACPKLAESQRLDPGNGTLARLATCHEKQGRTATAWSEFTELVTSAQRAGQADRERFARQRIAALEPHLSRLTVIVPADIATTPGLVVQRDAIGVGAAAWGIGVPVDPGDHSIEVSAPGKQAWSTHVTIAASGDNKQVTVQPLATLEVAPTPAATEPASSTAPPVPEAPPIGASRSSQKTWGLVVGAVGLVGLGVGSYFGVKALSDSSDAKKECPNAACAVPAAIQQNDDAKTAAHIADVGIGVGVAGIAAGALLYFLAPSSQGIQVAPSVGAVNGLTVRKSW